MSIGFNPWNLIRSLKSVDQWGDTISANINGVGRNAFKSSEVMFGGNTTNVLKAYNPGNGMAGIQVAETQVSIGYSRVNWKQGDIINKENIETSFAIEGNGFFIVAEPKKTTWAPSPPSPLYFGGQDNGGVQQAFLTKDGEFHWAFAFDNSNNPIPNINPPEPVLVNAEGLVVLGDTAGASSDNFMAPITKSNFNSISKERPSIVEPTLDLTIDGSAPANVMEYEELQFSKYGSTIYQAPKSTIFKTIVNGSDGILDRRSSTDFNDYRSKLIEQALESSNVNLEDEVVELSASKSFYDALTKNFLVYLENTDSALRLFR